MASGSICIDLNPICLRGRPICIIDTTEQLQYANIFDKPIQRTMR